MERLTHTKNLMDWLTALPEVHSVRLYGSFARGCADALSDLDLSMEVAGDNGSFLLDLPGKLRDFGPVLFADYAPSLAPEKYVLTACLFPDTPFLLVDFTVTAEPHCPSVTKAMLMERNDPDAHLCKLFCANLKHYIRDTRAGVPLSCSGDIRKMWRKLHEKTSPPPEIPEAEMLRETRQILRQRCPAFQNWLDGFAPCLP